MPHAVALVVAHHRATVVVRREGEVRRVPRHDLGGAGRINRHECEKSATNDGDATCSLHFECFYRNRLRMSLAISVRPGEHCAKGYERAGTLKPLPGLRQHPRS